MKPKVGSLKAVNKIIKPKVNRRKKTQFTKIRNENGDIATNIADIKMIDKRVLLTSVKQQIG